MSQRVIRISELASTKDKQGLLPVSRATLWRWVKSGEWPAPFKLGPNTTVWDLDAVEAHLALKLGVPGTEGAGSAAAQGVTCTPP
jgi:prophage regulatory protein